MPHRCYAMFAGYNEWANRRLYAVAARLDAAQYRAERGAFFGSVHRTLNHLLVTDRIWMSRFTGAPVALALDAVLHEDFEALQAARREEDARIVAFVAGLDAAALDAPVVYANSAGRRFTQPLASALDHLFNHQTHHRGQVHALLTGFLGNAAVPGLDLMLYQRETGAGGAVAL